MRARFLFALVVAAIPGLAVASMPPTNGYKLLGAGSNHNVAVTPAQEAWSWGGNAGGKLGNGNTVDSTIPVKASGLADVAEVSAGPTFTLAVKNDGTVWAWGQNQYGQLGYSTSVSCPVGATTRPCSSQPQQVPGLVLISSVRAGWDHAVALRSDGTVWTWGSNINGQLGRSCVGAACTTPGQVTGVGTIAEIAAGSYHTLARKFDGTVLAWGRGANGELGNGLAADSSAPTYVALLSGITALSSRGPHSLALKSDGTVWAWGWNRYAQVDSSQEDRLTPVQVSGIANVVEIVTGASFSMVRRIDATVYAWGLDTGQLGAVGGDDCGYTFHLSHTFIRCAKSPLHGSAHDGAVSLAGGVTHVLELRPGNALVATGVAGASFDPAGSGPACPDCVGVAGSGGSVGIGSSASGFNLGTLNAGLAFGPQRQGTSASMPVTLSNYRTTPIAIYGISAVGDFSVTNNCAGFLDALSSCMLDIVFGPTGVGPREGTLTIQTDMADSPTVSFVMSGQGFSEPGAPTGVTATAGNASASVAFSPPASDGGAAIVSHTATSNPGGFTATGISSPLVVVGLANGTSYSFTVTATNVHGTSLPSAPSNAVIPAAPPSPPAASVTSDFNADGHPDILWSSTSSGATYVWYMNGPLFVNDAFIAQIDPSWKIQGVADFNGDGHPDLVWRNTVTGNTYVWYMNGSAFMSDAFLFGLPPQWVIQGVADFNADGKPDFLMRNTSSGVAFAWFFDNATAIGDQFLFSFDPVWKVEQVGDVNADGQPDLLFRNMGSGLSFAWYTQYSGGTLSLAGSTPAIFSIDPVWEIVQLADWNGDGKPDLLFRNASTGVVFVWHLGGNLTLGTSAFIVQIDPGWEIVPRR